MSARGVCPYDRQGSLSSVPRRGGLEIDTAHDSPYCPEAEDVLKMYCVDQDPEIKDAQLKELERWSEYSF